VRIERGQLLGEIHPVMHAVTLRSPAPASKAPRGDLAIIHITNPEPARR
jgi:hypothetical protein